jgi:hypothetical protein
MARKLPNQINTLTDLSGNDPRRRSPSGGAPFYRLSPLLGKRAGAAFFADLAAAYPGVR